MRSRVSKSTILQLIRSLLHAVQYRGSATRSRRGIHWQLQPVYNENETRDRFLYCHYHICIVRRKSGHAHVNVVPTNASPNAATSQVPRNANPLEPASQVPRNANSLEPLREKKNKKKSITKNFNSHLDSQGLSPVIIPGFVTSHHSSVAACWSGW